MGFFVWNLSKERSMEDSSDCSSPLSTLFCHEEQDNSFHSDADEDHYIEILVSKETNPDSPNMEFLYCKWLRRRAIQWFLKMRQCFGFSAQTVYHAVCYFDRFLIRRTIDKEKSWALQLLALACLSLAAKMEEVISPPLMEYQTEQCSFDSNTIQRMELLVLSTLEWRMGSVTPFSYIKYFSNKIYGSNLPRELLSKSIGFIFSILKEINLVEFRASVIAAAAVLAAMDQKLTRKTLESKMKSVPYSGLMETELVYSCYNLMSWESKKRPLEFNTLDSYKLLEFDIDDNLADLSEISSLSDSNNKRRRLQKPQIDQNSLYTDFHL